MISELRSRLQQRRVARQKRVQLGQALFVALLVIMGYLLVSFDDCPGKDLAELSDEQRSEVASRKHSQLETFIVREMR